MEKALHSPHTQRSKSLGLRAGHGGRRASLGMLGSSGPLEFSKPVTTG